MYLAAGLVIIAGVAIAVKLYRQYAQPPYDVTVVSVRDITDHGVTVVFDVSHSRRTGRHVYGAWP
jgi:hypothetical protein